MSIKRTIITTIVALALVAMVAPSVQAVTIDELMAQIGLLQAQLLTLQGSGATPVPTGAIACAGVTFTRNLTVGSTGSDVKCLQVLLNNNGFTLAQTGAGSPGMETSYFGSRTLAVVKAFQVSKGWTPANQVGPMTRAVLNALINTTGGTTGGTVIPPSAGGLSISLASDNPAATTVPDSAFNQPVLKVNLTAGSGDVSVTRLAVTRGGLSANTDIDLLKVFDGTIQKGNGSTLNSSNQAVFTFTTPLVIPANSTKTLTIKADMHDGADTGHSIVFSVAAPTDVTSNATSTVGSAVGNAIGIANITIGSISITAGPSNPSSDFAPDVGDTSVRLLQMHLTAATEDIDLKQVIAVKGGTVNTTDISKVTLFNDTDNTTLGTVTTFDAEGRVTFDLATPLTITKGNSKNISVLVDIASGSARTISAKVYDAAAFTITAVGKTYGYGVTLTNGTTDWDAVTAGNNIGQGVPQTIAAGTLNVARSTTSPATGFVAPGGTDVALVTYDIESRGEGTIISRFVNTVVLTTSGLHTFAYTDVTNCKLVDENGNVIAGPVDTTIAGTATDDFIAFTDTFTVPLGIHKYTVKCNLASAITGGTIRIGFNSANTLTVASGGVAGTDTPTTAITAKGSSTYETVSASPTASVLGNIQTIRGADMDIATLTTPVAATIVPGQSNVLFANIQLSAVSSGENLNITSIGVTDTVDTSATESEIQSLRIFDASIAQSACTGTGRTWDTALAMCRLAPSKEPVASTAKTTFTLSTPLVISKASTSTVKVYGNYKTGATDNHTFDIAVVGDIVAVGATTGTTLDATMKGTTPTGNGQKMSYAANGTLTTTLDTGRPNSANITVGEYGTTGVIMTKVKLYAPTEEVAVDHVDFTRTSGGTGADADIAAVYLYDGTTLIATAGKIATNVYRFDFSASPYTLGVRATKILTVKADFNGVFNGATSAYRDAFDIAATTDLVATGVASGTTIYASAVVNTQPDMYLYRSTPTFTLCTIGTTTCGVAPTGKAMTRTASTEVFRFKITANSAGDVEFLNANSNTIRFKLEGAVDDTAGTDTTITFRNITDGTTLDSITTDVSDVVLGTTGGSGVLYYLTNDFTTNNLQIAAGESKIVAMEVDTTDFEDAYDSLKVSIQNAAADMNWSDVSTASIANNTFFTWLPLTGDTITTNP